MKFHLPMRTAGCSKNNYMSDKFGKRIASKTLYIALDVVAWS